MLTAAAAKAAADAAPPPPPQRVNDLWAEKYRPTTVDGMCYPAMANKLKMWLRDFDPTKEKAHRGCLLSGPPGIGKTTTVHVVANELGMHVIEFNASDHRSKRSLKEAVSDLITNRTLTHQGTTSTRKPLLLMDEVDGCDRGGVTEVIQLLKETKIPVLCTCNDRWHQKLRSLVNHVEDFKFSRPPFNHIASWIQNKVLRREGVEVPTAVLEEFIRQSGNDIRSVLGNLQMWTLTQRQLSQQQVAALQKRSVKNETVGIFDAAEAFLKPQDPPKSFEELQSIFYSADLVDLFIQENYIHWNPQQRGKDWMSSVAAASDCISLADRVSQSIYTEQSWSLSNTHLLLSSVMPTALVRGKYESFLTGPAVGFDKARPIKFPMWLGNNSTSGKHRRLLMCVTKEGSHTEGFTGTGVDVVTDYLPFALSSALVQPLVEKEKGGIADVTKVMEQYNLSRDDWDWIHEIVRYKKKQTPPNRMQALLGQVPTAVKSAFTREFNKTHQKESLAKSALRNVAKDTSAGPRAGEEEEEDSEDDLDVDAQAAKAVAAKKASKAKAKASKAAVLVGEDGTKPKPKPKAKAKRDSKRTREE